MVAGMPHGLGIKAWYTFLAKSTILRHVLQAQVAGRRVGVARILLLLIIVKAIVRMCIVIIIIITIYVLGK